MEINPDIISEIRGASKTKPNVKEFLIWLVNFEKEKLDRERFSYKPDILKKIDELIDGGAKQKEDD